MFHYIATSIKTALSSVHTSVTVLLPLMEVC